MEFEIHASRFAPSSIAPHFDELDDGHLGGRVFLHLDLGFDLFVSRLNDGHRILSDFHLERRGEGFVPIEPRVTIAPAGSVAITTVPRALASRISACLRALPRLLAGGHFSRELGVHFFLLLLQRRSFFFAPLLLGGETAFSASSRCFWPSLPRRAVFPPQPLSATAYRRNRHRPEQ